MGYTIQDIAKELNLSHSTVSRVLNNSRNVKPDTRKLVLDKIESMGFVPNAIASALRTRNRMIAVVTQDILNPYYAEAMVAMEKICRENGFFLLHLNSDNDPLIEERNLYQLLSLKVQGVILLANMLDARSRYMKICTRAIKVVSVDGHVKGADSILSESADAIDEAVRYLYSMGHTRIGVCHGECRSMPIQRRFDEFKHALEKYAIPFDESYAFFSEKEEGYLEKLERALNENRLPTALFTLNDNTAVQVYHLGRRLGISIPKDLSLIGFDDVASSRLLLPPLTTIAQPIGKIGEAAITVLLSRIREDADQPSKILRFPAKLVVRASVFDLR